MTIKGNNCVSREKFRLTVRHLPHVLIFGNVRESTTSLMHVIDKLSRLRRTDDFSSANGKNSSAEAVIDGRKCEKSLA